MKLGLLLTAVILLGGCSRFQPGVVPGAPRSATYADIDGVNVRYLELSEKEGAPWVVLIHGFASSLETWNAIAPRARQDPPRDRPRPQRLRLDEPARGRLLAARPRPRLVFEADGPARRRAGRGRRALVGFVGGPRRWRCRARAGDPPRPLRRLGLRGAAPDLLRVGARGRASGRRSFDLFYGERADERMALAFYDKERYVTEPFVERGRGGARAAGHARRRPRGRARPALRGSGQALPHHQAAHAPPLGSRGSGDAPDLRRAPGARSPERAPRGLPAVRPLPDDRGGGAVEPTSSNASLHPRRPPSQESPR